ncbi:MAG: DapH/DapD/GlmU-related protein [Eubacteriales bacterium]|nr:DapH/DapD/GlmU-related protein [Eubacteriales bacterium]
MHVIRQYKGIPVDLFGTIEIGNNVFIGMNTIVLPGVKIGNNVVIGAGSIVSKDIPNNSVACGIPARVIETLDEYYCKNKDKMELTKNMTKEKKRDYLLDKYNIKF